MAIKKFQNNDAIETQIGEVQATPTEFSLLRRLKDLLTGIVLATGSNIVGRVGIDQTTPGTTNAVSLTGRKLAKGNADYGTALNIAAAGNTSITVTPAAGELWRIKSLRINFPVPAGGASGTHVLSIRDTFNDSKAELLYVSAAYNVAIDIQNNVINTGTAGYLDTKQLIQNVILNMIVTNANPLIFKYTNQTDVTANGTCIIYIVREVEYIVS